MQYYSPSLSRWIHVDPSEGKTNQPLLYSIGWGKKMSYIIAFGLSGAQDVTLGYHLSDTLPSGRNSMTERELQAALEEVTRRRRAGCERGERETLEEEDKAQELWLMNVEGRREEEEERKRREGSLTGRESGAREWRESRQEDGGVKVDRGDALLKSEFSLATFLGLLMVILMPTRIFSRVISKAVVLSRCLACPDPGWVRLLCPEQQSTRRYCRLCPPAYRMRTLPNISSVHPSLSGSQRLLCLDSHLPHHPA